ncbi:putative regulatory protein [Streptomyces himastatinicus ATCC 53653]|uniref:Putative regulatory protein n=1 Tax=Streptomyces himastatinicus ATCC 53653 TaxID=457427 RepID=D9W857_9ACTN|nr:ATP-binding protein [Streptomyces himastatinicus]EFL22564.1 putative regulatory protein [Streptomyces himastatinicus ATCC 53653]
MATVTADHERRDTFRVSKRRRNVPIARTRVRKALANWGVDADLADDITLSADELLSNAIRHCRVTFAQIEISVSVRAGDLLLEVTDPDGDKLPELRAPSSDEEGGRGLYLVAKLADEWGHSHRQHAKCVWARFVIPNEVTCTD